MAHSWVVPGDMRLVILGAPVVQIQQRVVLEFVECDALGFGFNYTICT